MTPVRIGINALYFIPGGVGGSEIYLRSLIRALGALGSPHEFTVFTNWETQDGLVPAHPNWLVRQTGVRAKNRPARLFYEQALLPLRSADLDVLFCPGFTAPALTACPTVTTIHDLQHLRHPEYFRWFELPFWRYFVWQSVRTSSRIIAVSESTRSDLLQYYSTPEKQVVVAWHGVDEEFSEIRLRREGRCFEPILLCPSTTHPHKNHSRLLRVFRRFRISHPEWRLLLTGIRGFADEAIRNQVESTKMDSGILSLGWLPRRELYACFERAAAVIYPTTFEGFGLPVLEGLAAGIPTACSDIEPLRTIAGDAAVLFDPASEDSMLDALERTTMSPELRERLSQSGPLRASQFTWRKCAESTLEVLLDAARQGTR
jgi:glycosyltransferase involved in cell wall biosynthesis